MKTTANPNGREVIVCRGREITEAQLIQLGFADRAACVRKINGPHHESKWAQDLYEAEADAGHAAFFFGTNVRKYPWRLVGSISRLYT